MRLLAYGVGGAVLLVLAGLVGFLYFEAVGNPKVVRELRENPQGERASKVMLITLPSGREIPVNYLREDDRVYVGADGRWWKELVAENGREVTLVIRGETLKGRARAIVDDPEYTQEVFARLRPTAVPGFGTLIEIRLM